MSRHLYDASEEAMHFPAGVLMPGYFIEAPGFHQHRKAGRKDWMLTFTLGGHGQFRVGDFIHTCGVGDIVVVPPEVPQHYATKEDGIWEFLWVHFVPRPHWLQWLKLPAIGSGLLGVRVDEPADRERLELAFRRVVAYKPQPGPFDEAFSLHALEEVVLLAAWAAHRRAAGRRMDERIEATLIHLGAHLQDDHTVETLAARACLSPSRFAHLYKAETGESVMDTLRRLRLQEAAKWLEFTSRTVTEIAAEVGFHSPFHFARRFKAYYGVNPSAYRERALSVPEPHADR